MPDSFSLTNTSNMQPNPANQPAAAPVAPQAAPTSDLKLSDVVFQQQDAIVFDGARIPSVKTATEAFIIFYLTLQDEENGYGTVIQLDPATKQAAIFADLNPEYTYLFYKDEQGQLQTMLWCIEFATRTSDGLYVTQAKVHGKGITEADMQHLSQMKMPNAEAGQQHSLPEQDSVMPAQPPQPAAQPPMPSAEPTITPDPVAPQPTVAPSESVSPVSQPAPSFESTMTPINQPAPPFSQQPTPPFQSFGSSDVPASSASSPEPALNLPPLPNIPASSQNNSAPQPSLDPKPDWNTPRPTTPEPMPAPQTPSQDWSAAPATAPISADAQPLPDLPPLPDLSATPAQKEPVSDQFAPPATPAPAAFSPVASMPTQPSDTTTHEPAQSPQPSVFDANGNKNPVGRPPKPLTADAAWLIEPQDFNWLKSISRDNWTDHQDELRQKLIKQIRKNRPNLIDDWQFHGVLEQAFQAIGQTYDLVPPLRHDLLKSLLNGKVVDQVIRQMKNL